jgi:ribosomal protein S7
MISARKLKEAVALELAAKEAKEQAGKVITPWEMELEMLEDWLNNPGPARELTEVELSGKVTEQQVSQRETAELKSAAEWQLEATDEDEEDGMGDHGDLPNCRKFLQLRRLHEQDQPWSSWMQ